MTPAIYTLSVSTIDLSELTFRPFPGDVLVEVFGDEAVVVQLRTGTYYAFDVGVTGLWTLLETERALSAVADTVVAQSGRPQSEVEEELHRFASYLAAEQLAEFGRQLPMPEVTTWPGISRFTDMADLLLLDPIHDIDLDGDGWPIVTTERPGGS
jgi:hypothetical protein